MDYKKNNMNMDKENLSAGNKMASQWNHERGSRNPRHGKNMHYDIIADQIFK
jgi:predicted AAA+ superfamily ATPase